MPDHPTTTPGDKLMQRFEDLDDPRRQTGRFQFPLQELLLTARWRPAPRTGSM